MAAIVLIAGFCYLEAIVIAFIQRVFRSALEMVLWCMRSGLARGGHGELRLPNTE